MGNAPANIRVSREAAEIMDMLVKDGYFDSIIASYRAAIPIAISQSLHPDPSVRLADNKWDTPAVFNNRECNLENLILLFFPDEEEPIILGMQLAEQGLRWLEDKRIRNEPLWQSLAGI